MDTYRTGNHWGVTIVRQGERTPEGHIVGPDELVAVVVNGDQALAERIVALLNRAEAGPRPITVTLAEPTPGDVAAFRSAVRRALGSSCTCDATPDPNCPVHHGRRARGPKPEPVGPGCICDGSGRTCPRHGAVL
jgi:hypothetical protein